MSALEADGLANPVLVGAQLRARRHSEALLHRLSEALAPNDLSPQLAHRYAVLVSELGGLRRVRELGRTIVGLTSTGASAADALAEAEALLGALEVGEPKEEGTTIQQLLALSLDNLEAQYEGGSPIVGVPTGFRDLDERLKGLQPGRLYIVGARPSMGKAAFALNIAVYAATTKAVPTLFFSLEMDKDDLTRRMLCAEARVDSSHLESGRLRESQWPRLVNAIDRLKEAPLVVVDEPGLTLDKLRAAARRQQRRGGLGLIIVDYLQLIAGRKNAETRQVEVAEMSRGLKVLARDLRVPVVALSRLSRGLEMRENKRPVLADLRESGGLENDADVVIFIYRDEVYREESYDKGVAELIVAKNRQGATGTERLAFLNHFTRFENMARV